MKSVIRNSAVFDLDRIERESFVRQLVFRKVVRSTNDLALRLASRGDLRLPLLILAEQQTGGRGRGANRWWSARGSLTFSVLFGTTALDVGPDRWPQLSLSAAVAVSDAVDEICPNAGCGIRWPNDVYFAGRKVCGILSEPASGRSAGPGCVVVGIGINVNNSFSDAPPDVVARGGSLAELTGNRYEPGDVLLRVLGRLHDRLEQLSRRDSRLSDAWSARCELCTRTVELALGPRRVRGRCQGVDRDGALLLRTGAQTERFFGGVIAAVE